MKKAIIIATVCSFCLIISACSWQIKETTETTTASFETKNVTEKSSDTTKETEKPTEKSTEEPTVAPIEVQTEELTEADYSSYLGKWSYKNMPDEIPDEILNNDTDYQMYIERIPTTTLDFKIIDGNKVEFELTKGNILTVADANISGLIVDGVIDFEYIDGWGSKGHGTITLNEDSVHVYCVQNESNTYNSPSYRGASLDCDETLTRQ